MIEGIYISGSGMLPKAARQEALANNLANVGVPGFKRNSMFMREMREAAKQQSGDYPDWRINRFEGTWIDLEQGKMRHTGDSFDLALNGHGFFAVRTPQGVQYTRNGSLSRNSQGTLVNALGYPVLDTNGDEIAIPPEIQTLVVGGSGAVSGRDASPDGERAIARLQIVDFPELYDPAAKARTPYQPPLIKSKDGFFVPRPGAVRVDAERCEVAQGYLEEANVEPVREMVEMIDLYRSYEADYRAIQAQDSTLERTVNEVGRVG
jgi:flagellar basal-body rod protein FlgF